LNKSKILLIFSKKHQNYLSNRDLRTNAINIFEFSLEAFMCDLMQSIGNQKMESSGESSSSNPAPTRGERVSASFNLTLLAWFVLRFNVITLMDYF